MKANKTYILAVIFIVLAVLAYFLTTDRGEKTATYKLEKKLFNVDSAAVDKLEFEQNGKKVTLVKSGVEWKMTEPVEYTAFPQFVGSVLSDLKKYKLESKVSDNPNNKDRYGFNDTNFLKLTVYQGGNPVGTMLIGSAPPSPGQTFVKKPGSDEIFLAGDFVRSNFVKENMINDWRDKHIFSIPKGNIKSVDFVSSSDNYRIESDSTGKYFVGKDSVNSQVADGVYNMFQNLSTQGFKDSTISDNEKFDHTIKINADKEYVLNFLKSGGDENNPKYILKISGIKQLFEVDGNFLKMIFKPKKEIISSK